MPNGQAGWFGRNVVERILPGTQINPQTGGYQNVGKGVLGAAGRIGAGFLGGPAASAGVGKLAGNWIDRGNPFAFRDASGAQIPGMDYQSGYMPTVGTVMPGQPAFDPSRRVSGPQMNMGLPSQPQYSSPNQLGQSSFDGQGNTINDRMNMWGANPASRNTRSGNTARSSTLAEGADAQNYVANMQLGSWLGMKAPTGPGAVTNRRA